MARTKRVLPPLENERYYGDVLWLSVPLLCVPYYFYGIRPVLLCIAAVVIANICDRLEAKMRGSEYNPKDWSSESFAALLALLMPASIPWYVLVVAVLACVLLGKGAFGGYGSYPFHPTAVGYAVAAVSWPVAMFQYPQPFTKLPILVPENIPLTTSLSGTLKHGGLPIISDTELWLGNTPGAFGTTAILVICASALLLWVRRDINIPTVLSFLLVCAAISFLFPQQDGLTGPIMETLYQRLDIVKFELLSGGLLFGAIFLISEPYTCPKHWLSRFVYGGLLGLLTMMFRYYGVYETGICFALLLVSTIASWMDRTITASWSTYKANRALQRAQHKGGSLA